MNYKELGVWNQRPIYNSAGVNPLKTNYREGTIEGNKQEVV